MTHAIPPALSELMISRGQAGETWLASLPGVLGQLEFDWQLTLAEPFPHCYCNYVTKVKLQAGQSAVLKVGYPDEEFYRELDFLRLQTAGPMPQLLKVDETIPAILLEEIQPATTLATVEDEATAVTVAAHLMRRLWQPVPVNHRFRPTAALFESFIQLKNQPQMKSIFQPTVIQKAEQAYLSLQQDLPDPVLMHGDLHHFNIIKDESRGWMVIDPSGMVGAPAYEPAAFLRNPGPISEKENLSQLLSDRISLFAQELGLDAQRIYLWGLFQTVLASFWVIEDNASGLKGFIKTAETLAELDF